MKTNFTNEEIAQILRDVAASYAIKDEKKYKFQIIAYQKAADAIETSSTQVRDLYSEGKLEKIPGIGPSMKASLEELFSTGKVEHFQKVMGDIPPAVFSLLGVPTFGPKKAFRLASEFHLTNPETAIDDVMKIAQEGRIAELEGFGEKSEADIARAIEEYKLGKTKTNRMVLPFAYEIAEKVLDYLKKSPDVIEAFPLGSLRRRRSTIGDVDIAVATKNPEKVLEYFASYPQKERLIEKGTASASFLTAGGKQVDLMVQPPESFGSLLQHFTGSKQHNIALREYALKKGLSLSEYGIKTDGKIEKFATEEAFYKRLGLDFIPPEIREDLGEIELAAKGKLPELIQLSDIKGDLQIHSNFPIEPSHDLGQDPMEDIVQRAIGLGYSYIGFSEHNPSVGNHTSKQIYDLIQKRNEYIDQHFSSNKSIRVLKLLEVDVLASGKLSLDDKAMDLLDGALVSIHSSFNMDEKAMTERILSGLSHPKAKILAHPTGRILNQRPGYDAQWSKIFEFCAQHDKAIEINAWPGRLDLPDVLVKQAKDMGVKFVISTDSHAVSHMDNMLFGVAVARRGWCEKKDILNALPFEKFYNWLKK